MKTESHPSQSQQQQQASKHLSSQTNLKAFYVVLQNQKTIIRPYHYTHNIDCDLSLHILKRGLSVCLLDTTVSLAKRLN